MGCSRIGEKLDPKEEFKEFKQFAEILKQFIEQLNYESVTRKDGGKRKKDIALL